MLIDKPAGWTSHDAIAVVRRRLGQRSIGHSGTLDPFATGLLVMLMGRATRLARFVEATSKEYQAVFRFGSRTDSDDGTGAVVATVTPSEWPDRAVMEGMATGFVGSYLQRPPAFSAKHVAGTRSHRLARAGRAVELAPVEVRIDAVDVVAWEPPDLTIRARVGGGTYLRALARDIGDRLGIPAHCAELRRTAVGPFLVSDAVAPEQVTREAVRAPVEMVRHLPGVQLDPAAAADVGFGRAVPRRPEDGAATAALLGPDGRLIGMAEARDEVWQPVVVLEPA